MPFWKCIITPSPPVNITDMKNKALHFYPSTSFDLKIHFAFNDALTGVWFLGSWSWWVICLKMKDPRFFQLQNGKWAFKLIRLDLVLYIHKKLYLSSTLESGILWGNNYMLSCHTMSFTNFCNSHVYCDCHHILSNNTIKRT